VQEGSIVRDENGVVVVEGTMLDVTDRHLLELQLRQAQKMEAVGRLAGGVAHDFNNLLTVINSYSELQLSETAPGTPEHDYADQIRTAGMRAASLTRQLLVFSRRQVLQPQIVNLNTVLANLDKMLMRLIGEHIQVNTILAPILGSVKVDPGQIEQVVMNLVLNARDAMPRGGSLTMETANLELTESYVRAHHEVTPGHYVLLTVSDTGTGMDADVLSHIFEPFFTTKEKGKGTGLGLATVYGIIKQSGGYIWAYSEVDRGTTFKIYLPRVDEMPQKLEHQRMSREELHGTETILVVEDDRALRDLAESILAGRGYRVLAATTPDEVDTACRTFGYELDLLLTDVVMPIMSGREIAARVTACCPKVKVLYMSGYTSDAILHHGVLEGGIALLQKPFTPTSLIAKVREVLDEE
jgi:nitrogen-specific signal transduction histidine kinase/ActR/RegA family two-component response regulator